MKKKDLELFKKYSPKLAEVLKLKNDDKFHVNYNLNLNLQMGIQHLQMFLI